MIYTPQQIEQFALNAGFRNEDVRIAIGVAHGESSFDDSEYNPEEAWFADHGIPLADGEGSIGLWQIFSYVHKDKFPGWNLRDPQVNACAANILFRSGGWNQWASYKFNSPQYQKGLAIADSLHPVVVSDPELGT